jgi:hypothetical protein
MQASSGGRLKVLRCAIASMKKTGKQPELCSTAFLLISVAGAVDRKVLSLKK